MAEDTDVARVAAVLRAPSIRYRSFGNAPVRAPLAAEPPASAEPFEVEAAVEPQWADAQQTPWPASEARWSVESAETWAEPAPAPQWAEPARPPAPAPVATVAPAAEPFQWADAPALAEPSREWAVAAPPAYHSQGEWSEARPDMAPPVAAPAPPPVAAYAPPPVAAYVPPPVAAYVPPPVAAYVPPPVAAYVPPPVAAPAVIRPQGEQPAAPPIAAPPIQPVAEPVPAPVPSQAVQRSLGMSPTLLELGSMPPPPVEQAMPRPASSPFPLIAALDLPSGSRSVLAATPGAPVRSLAPAAPTVPPTASKADEAIVPAARLKMPLVELLQFVAAIDTASAAVAPR